MFEPLAQRQILLVHCTGRHQIMGRTQLSDVALFRAFQKRICEFGLQCRLLRDKLKPHR